jgi:hypothetical protein
MERAVGWFVFLATALLLFGFGCYIYHTAEHKGWFKIKAPFHIYVASSAGLNVGDPVYMMGFSVGKITQVEPQPPRSPNNVRVDFELMEPYFHHLWRDGSFAKINGADLLGKRQLEVTRGTNGYAWVVTQRVFVKTVDELKPLVADQPDQWQLSQEVFDERSNLVFHAYDTLSPSNLEVIAALKVDSLSAYNNRERDERHVVAAWDERHHSYKIFTPTNDSAWLRTVEAPPVSDELQAIVVEVQAALPNVLALTNRLATALDHADLAVSNLAAITGDLRGPGALGTWALGANASFQLASTLTNVSTLLVGVDTNLDKITDQMDQTLQRVADLTSNLNVQVQANSNLLGGIAKTVTDADSFVQGLKHHWLLRSAFKNNPTNQPALKPSPQSAGKSR